MALLILQLAQVLLVHPRRVPDQRRGRLLPQHLLYLFSRQLVLRRLIILTAPQGHVLRAFLLHQLPSSGNLLLALIEAAVHDGRLLGATLVLVLNIDISPLRFVLLILAFRVQNMFSILHRRRVATAALLRHPWGFVQIQYELLAQLTREVVRLNQILIVTLQVRGLVDVSDPAGDVCSFTHHWRLWHHILGLLLP